MKENYFRNNAIKRQMKQNKIRNTTLKLRHRTAGSYRVLQTHVNRTLTTELKPGISERINIHRVIRYKE